MAKWLLWLGFILFTAPVAQAQQQPMLTIAADLWCPINCTAEQPHKGIGIDLAKEIFEPLGYRVNYVIIPWARALQEVREGKVDAVVGANQSDDKTLLFPQTPIIEITDDFYMRAGSTLPFNMKALEGQRIGIVTDYGYGPIIERFIKEHRKTPGIIQEVGGDDALDQNIKKLLANRIDVIIESEAIMHYRLMQLHLEDKIKHIGGYEQGHVYLAFSPALKASAKHTKEYDEGIARLKAAEELNKLYERYGLHP